MNWTKTVQACCARFQWDGNKQRPLSEISLLIWVSWGRGNIRTSLLHSCSALKARGTEDFEWSFLWFMCQHQAQIFLLWSECKTCSSIDCLSEVCAIKQAIYLLRITIDDEFCMCNRWEFRFVISPRFVPSLRLSPWITGVITHLMSHVTNATPCRWYDDQLF